MNAIMTRLVAVLVWCPLALGCADAVSSPPSAPAAKADDRPAPPTASPPTAADDKVKRKDEGRKEEPKEEKEKVLATAKHPKGLVVDLTEVKVDKNEYLVLRWRYSNPTKRTIRLVEGNGPFATINPPTAQFYKAVHYHEGKLESETAYRHDVLKFSDGRWHATDIRKSGIEVGPGETFEVWARMSLPKNPVERIAVQLPEVEAFEDVTFKYTPKQ